MIVRLVFMNLDGDRFGFVRLAIVVTVIVIVIAIRPVNMRRRGRGCAGISGWVRMAMAVAACAVGTAFRLERFLNRMHDQVQGP